MKTVLDDSNIKWLNKMTTRIAILDDSSPSSQQKEIAKQDERTQMEKIITQQNDNPDGNTRWQQCFMTTIWNYLTRYDNRDANTKWQQSFKTKKVTSIRGTTG
jgi:hypothetical protein